MKPSDERGGVSPAQWLALFILPVVALVLIVLAYHNDLGWQLTAGGAYIAAVCAAMFVILAHDRPFVGYLGVKPTPIELAMQRLQRASDAPPPPQAAPKTGVQ
jgi:predicted lysophospholipase L1 biosynthesis ABC-type transport system permease subunit